MISQKQMNGKVVFNRHIGHYSKHHHETSPSSNGSIKSKARSLRGVSIKAKKGKKKKNLLLSNSLKRMEVPNFQGSFNESKNA